MLRGSPRRPIGILATRRQPPALQQRRHSYPLLAAAAAVLLLASSGVVLFRHLGAGSLPDQQVQPVAGASGGYSHGAHRELREHHLGSRPTNTLSRETGDDPGLSASVTAGNQSTSGLPTGSADAVSTEAAAVDGGGAVGDAGEVTAPSSSSGTGSWGSGTAHGADHSDTTPQPAASPAQAPAATQPSEAELHGGWKLSREVGERSGRGGRLPVRLRGWARQCRCRLAAAPTLALPTA